MLKATTRAILKHRRSMRDETPSFAHKGSGARGLMAHILKSNRKHSGAVPARKHMLTKAIAHSEQPAIARRRRMAKARKRG